MSAEAHQNDEKIIAETTQTGRAFLQRGAVKEFLELLAPFDWQVRREIRARIAETPAEGKGD